jgi:hypothetical protein
MSGEVLNEMVKHPDEDVALAFHMKDRMILNLSGN